MHQRRLVSVMLRSVVPTLLVRLLPAFAALLFGVVEAAAMVDPVALAASIRALPPLWSGLLAAAVVVGWASSAGWALRHALDPRRLAWLRRQPLSDGAWTLALAIPLAIVALPAIAASAFWGTLSEALLFGVIAACIALIGRPLRVGALFAGILAIERAVPGVWPLLFASPALVVGAVHLWRAESARVVGAPLRSFGRPRSAASALVRRDLLALWRLERRALSGLLWAPPLVALVVLALAARGERLPAVLAGLLGLAIAAFPAADVTSRLAQRLGRHLDVASWPVTPRMRAATLLAVPLLALAPATAAAATGVGPLGHSRLLALTLALAAGAVALAVTSARRVNVGVYIGWVFLVVAVAFARPPVGVIADLGLAGAAFAASVEILRRARGLPS